MDKVFRVMEEKIILECYQCSTQFKITPSLLGTQGKKVRCIRCKHEWIAKAPAEDIRNLSAEQPIFPSPSTSLLTESSKKENLLYRAPLATKSNFLLNMIVIIVLLSTIAAVLYIGRYQIADLIPSSRTLYKQIGIDVGDDLKAFSLSNLTHTHALQNGIATIIIRGKLTNTDEKQHTTPMVIVTLYGTGNCPVLSWKDKLLHGDFTNQEDGHCALEKWSVSMGDGTIAPSQTISMETSRPINPDWDIKHVFIDLAQREYR